MRYLLGLILIVILVAFLPFVTIWSLNTLFPVLNIDYTFETWAATMFLSSGIFGKNVRVTK